MSLLLALIARLEPPAPPENGPSGGSNWTRGYKPKYEYIATRKSRREEILFLRG